MTFLKDRPLLTVTAVFAAAAFLFRPIPAWGKLILLLTAALAVAGFALLRLLPKGRRPDVTAILLLLIGLFSGTFSSWLHFDVRVASVTAWEGKKSTLEAEILEWHYRSDYFTSLTVRGMTVDGISMEHKLLLTINGACDGEIGDVVTLPVTFSLPPEREDGFPVASYYASQGVHLFAEADEEATVTVTQGNGGLLIFFDRLSDTLSARLRHLLGDERGGFLSGILLGRKDDIAEHTRRDFRYLGLSHILAVSGLHLTVLTGGLLVFLRLFRLPRLWQTLLCILAILFAAVLTGFPSSVVRAGIMLILNLIAFATGDRYHPPTALALSAALILLVSPGSVCDVGFLLSVSATAGILALGSPWTSAILKATAKKPTPLRILGRLLATMALTVSAVFFTLPFSAYYFGEFSIVSPVANLLYVPLSVLLLYIGLFTLLLYDTFLFPFVAQLASDVSGFLLETAKDLTRIVPEPVSLAYDFTIYSFAAAATVFLLLLGLKAKRLPLLLTPLVAFTAVFGGCYYAHHMANRDVQHIVAVNYDQNDYLLLHGNGKTLLCDISTGGYSSLKKAASLSAEVLLDSSPDGLFLTHLHTRHIASFSRLADNFRLSCLILPVGYDEASIAVAEALIAEAEERHIAVFLYRAETGDRVVFGPFTLQADPLSFLDRSSQPLCRLTVTGHNTVTYWGASLNERRDWESVVGDNGEVDVLLLGSHGPIIKKPLYEPLQENVFAANDDVNAAYQTAYTIIRKESSCYRLFTWQQKE